MYSLIIDQGNTRCKAALWCDNGGDDWIDVDVDGSMDADQASAIFKKYDIDGAIYSSTAVRDDELERYLVTQKALIFSHSTPVPIVNDYKSAATLGLDRLAAAVGGAALYPNQDIMIVDMGSAITIDFVSASGHFLGGNISAGMAMRLDALHHFTGRLPRVDVTDADFIGYGQETRGALIGGAVQGICNEIDGYIDQNRNKVVICTGGDAIFFELRIKNTIFVDCRLTLRGLLSILRYNA